MAVEYRGAITVVVLDDGSAEGQDLVDRVDGVFPNLYRMTDREAPGDEEHILRVDSKHMNIKTLVSRMHAETACWAVVPNVGDPAVMIADFLSAARPPLADGFPAFVMIWGRPERRYEKIAVVVDVTEPFTTGSLALAAVGLASRTGAAVDALMLGGDPDDPPESFESIRHLFKIREGASLLQQALDTAAEIGLHFNWVPLGEATERDQLVLDAVRENNYDLVLDDLRPIDIGPRFGRLKRVRRQLVDSDSVDTAYRLLRDAPCDVAIVVDAVRMQLVPGSYVKAGAVAALSLGTLGAATLPAASASASAATSTTTVEAPLDPAQTAAPQEEAAPEVAAAPAAMAEVTVGTPAPSLDQVPQEVTRAQFDEASQVYSGEQQTLQTEQAELAALQAQQAAADQALTMAETDLALAQQDLQTAQDTRDSAQDRLDYAQGRNSLNQSEVMQAKGSLNRAEYNVDKAQASVDAAQEAVGIAGAEATAAAEPVAVQQAVVDAQAANLTNWTAVMAEAEARTAPEIVAPVAGYGISTHYGASGSHWASGHHTGSDFAAPTGTPIVAAADGVVIQAGNAGPYGNQTVIQHEDGTVTTYAHQSTITVSVGQSVKAGQQIGTVGSTGNSTGPHLHFEVFDASGNRLNPEVWLGDAI